MSKKKPLDNQSRPLTFTPPENLKLAHEDLRFFFQNSDAECGISSNYSAFLAAMFSSSSQMSAEEQFLDCLDKRKSEESIMKAAAKTRAILNRYSQLSSRHQMIAQLFHYEQQFDRSLEMHFGAGIKLIPFTESFQKLPKQWQDLHKLQYCLIHKRKLVDKMKKEVQILYLSVLEAYVQAQ